MLCVKAHNAPVRFLKQIHRKKPRTRNRGIPPPLGFDLDALPDNTRLSRRETAAVRSLKPWERPFPDPTQRLPQHRRVAAERREEKRRDRLWRAIRARKAAAGSGAQHC
jgi:hypothetical protein